MNFRISHSAKRNNFLVREMDSSSLSPHATTILDLNDDCLIEVCRHMHLMDLCVFADVCGRFRSSAQAYFEIYRNRDLLGVVHHGNLLENDSLGVARIFGVSIFKIVATPAVNHPVLNALLTRYCCENFIDLSFESCNAATRATVIIMGHLQKLHVFGCGFDNIMHGMLPQWTSHIQDLELFFAHTHGQSWFRYFQLPFPELKKLSFNHRCPTCFEFLRLNSQLTELALYERLHPDDHVLQFIAEHLTQIEHLRFEPEG